MALATGITATQVAAAAIDDELANGLDLRDLRFRVCFEQPVCEMDDVTLVAEIRQTSESEWEPGLLYWDPIDGIGVLGGGQDDEIDFNERIIIRFNTASAIDRIWLTDLYVGEVERYGSIGDRLAAEEDFEFAMIEFMDNGEVLSGLEVSGLIQLPILEFNDVYTDLMVDGGDLRFRMVVAGDEVAILVPDPDDNLREERFQSFRLGEIDSEKLALFAADGEEFPYDLNDIFPEGAAVNLYPEGSINARSMASVLNDTNQLAALQQAGVTGRDIGDVSNGEVAVAMEDDPKTASELVFYSAVGTSNDFSIGGVIFADSGT